MTPLAFWHGKRDIPVCIAAASHVSLDWTQNLWESWWTWTWSGNVSSSPGTTKLTQVPVGLGPCLISTTQQTWGSFCKCWSIHRHMTMNPFMMLHHTIRIIMFLAPYRTKLWGDPTLDVQKWCSSDKEFSNVRRNIHHYVSLSIFIVKNLICCDIHLLGFSWSIMNFVHFVFHLTLMKMQVTSWRRYQNPLLSSQWVWCLQAFWNSCKGPDLLNFRQPKGLWAEVIRRAEEQPGGPRWMFGK